MYVWQIRYFISKSSPTLCSQNVHNWSPTLQAGERLLLYKIIKKANIYMTYKKEGKNI
jgi:hypothetical protein